MRDRKRRGKLGENKVEKGYPRHQDEALQAALILRRKKEHTKRPSFVDSI